MSADSIKVQKNFATKQGFQFQLLSNPEKDVIRAYKAIGLKKCTAESTKVFLELLI